MRTAAPPPVRVAAAAEDPRGPAMEAYLVATLRKIGLRARRARTPAERVAAPDLVSPRVLPAAPQPARYLEGVGRLCARQQVRLLELEGLPSESAEEWAALDREVVEQALIAPYGVGADRGLALRADGPVNCRRFHPVYGLDWSSLCLRKTPAGLQAGLRCRFKKPGPEGVIALQKG